MLLESNPGQSHVVSNGIALLTIESFWRDVVRSLLLIVVAVGDQLRLHLAAE
jgi:ribose/xylose/arabinose/galactoside ABC-type transport system permease subunit